MTITDGNRDMLLTELQETGHCRALGLSVAAMAELGDTLGMNAEDLCVEDVEDVISLVYFKPEGADPSVR